ncbi:hypothetical protein PTTG_02474 [Puccinia triticina 1-1 BBBD Race 1]|uniref:Uncharacterized protein n=1 Tax=Puccinia triticina (isolate 1-1 / race 1 (BBBD)) TaxID=630390 RepID=A0A0C4ENX7_PUCT1|nr:hypothetical protein PTTG_02474 [Puccinia triticina 1-1 BBBD Race 1]
MNCCLTDNCQGPEMPHGHEVVTQEAESSRAFPREAVPLVKSEVSSPGGAVHCKKRPPITPFFPDQGSQAAPSLRKRFRLSFTTLPTSSTGNIDAMKTPLMILVALHCSLLCLGGKSSSKASGKYVTCASYDFSQSPNGQHPPRQQATSPPVTDIPRLIRSTQCAQIRPAPRGDARPAPAPSVSVPRSPHPSIRPRGADLDWLAASCPWLPLERQQTGGPGYGRLCIFLRP